MDYTALIEKVNINLGSLASEFGFSIDAEVRNFSDSPKQVAHREKVALRAGDIRGMLTEIFAKSLTSLDINWTFVTSDSAGIWYLSAALGISGFQSANASFNVLDRLRDEGRIGSGWDFELLRLFEEEGMVGIGQTGHYDILFRNRIDHEGLFLYLGSRIEPAKIHLNIQEFLVAAMEVNGLEEFPFYLTEDFPEQLKQFRYTGFFEKVEKFFPDADLSSFHHRELCNFAESTVIRDGRLDYKSRIEKAFSKMPDGTRFQRWHPKADVMIFPDRPTVLMYYQLLYDVKFSDEYESFYTASQTLEVCWLVNGNVKGRFQFPRLNDMLPKQHAPEYYKLSPEEAPHLVGKYVCYTDVYNHMLVQFEGKGTCSFHLLYMEADDYATHFITEDFDWLFQQLLNTRGMYWWNYYLVFKASAGDQRYAGFRSQMLAYFPDADMSLYPEVG